MSQAVFLKGKKTILRPVSLADAPMLTRWINDPEVRKFIGNNFPQSLQDEEGWVTSLGKKKDHELVFVIEKEDGGPIGTMGLHGIKWVDGTATTGALLGEKDFWGQGYGSDAKMALLGYAFNTLNLRKISSHVIAFNTRSARYSEKCGYREEGRLKDHVYRDGAYHDLILLAVFREDFGPLWEEYNK